MKYLFHLFSITFVLLIGTSSLFSSVYGCDLPYQWNPFVSLSDLQTELKENYEKHREPHSSLVTVEECLQEEAQKLNQTWNDTHFQLVSDLNELQEKQAKSQRLRSEIEQIKQLLAIQRQTQQSLRLIYQSRLMEIPKAYILHAKKPTQGDSKSQMNKQMEQDSLHFLKLKFADHHLHTSVSIKDGNLKKLFASSFQGGHSQSFGFDPISFLDKNRNWNYVQVYRLYPLFPNQKDQIPSNTNDSNAFVELEKLSKSIKKLPDRLEVSIYDTVPIGFHETLQAMSEKVAAINWASQQRLINLEVEFSGIPGKPGQMRSSERRLQALERQLGKKELELKRLPSLTKLAGQVTKTQSKLNEHVNTRKFIVVSNPSEIVTSESRIKTYENLLNIAWSELETRAKSLRSFTFFRVENKKLVTMEAGEFYTYIQPKQFTLPFFRADLEETNFGYDEKLGFVLGILFEITHLPKSIEFNIETLAVSPTPSPNTDDIEVKKKTYENIKTSVLNVRRRSFYLNVSPTEWLFTNAGAMGRFGPTQAQIDTSYAGTSLEGAVISKSGIQVWKVPYTGVYKIEVWGASGGGAGEGYGKGAKIIGDFDLIEEDVLKIVVGQKGVRLNSGLNYGGGGGGTFVTILSNIPLIIAGGGGGASKDNGPFMDASSDVFSLYGINANLASPSEGQGGEGSGSSGGGGGLFSDGSEIGFRDLPETGGYSFINGALGGEGDEIFNGQGGFGGGGGTCCSKRGLFSAGGGGGGYSGGDAGDGTNNPSGGGGGGSYNKGTNPINVSGYNLGHGRVKITLLEEK